MINKNIIFIAGIALGSFAAGFFAGKVYSDRKKSAEVKSENESEEVKEVTPTQTRETVSETSYNEVMEDFGYKKESSEIEEVQGEESDEEDENEEEEDELQSAEEFNEWYQANADKIVVLDRSDYPGELFPEYRDDSWDCKQLRLFIGDKNVLCEDDTAGTLLEPIQAFIGNIDNVINYPNDEVYVKNFPLNEHYLVVKDFDDTYESYFENYRPDEESEEE